MQWVLIVGVGVFLIWLAWDWIVALLAFGLFAALVEMSMMAAFLAIVALGWLGNKPEENRKLPPLYRMENIMNEPLSNAATTLALELLFQSLPSATRTKILRRISAILAQEIRNSYNDEAPDDYVSGRGKAAVELEGLFSTPSQ